MNKERTQKEVLVPRLRFPEFRETGEWDISRLSDVYKFKRTNTLSRDKLNYEVGTIKNIHYGDIHTKFKTRFLVENEDVPYINPEFTEINNLEDDFCEEGDIVFADASEDLNDIGKAIEILSLDGQPLVSGTHTILATRIGSKPILGFGGYLFQSPVARMQIQKEAQGTKVFGISGNRIASILIFLPKDISEQQKIAQCLSSLDDLMGAEERKLAALRDYKKGLMEQLFPREGETRPRLRFPEFREAGEWEATLLKEVCIINPTKTQNNENDLVSFIPMAAVSENGNIGSHEIRRYVDVEKGYTPFIENDVIIAKITPCFENGKAALALNLKNGMAFGSTEFHVFRSKEKCLPKFLFSYLYREDIRKSGIVNMTGNAGQRRVPASFFEMLPFYLPSIKEQQRIADLLSSLDELISRQAEKIEALKNHKKGLMQQLFPVIPESV